MQWQITTFIVAVGVAVASAAPQLLYGHVIPAQPQLPASTSLLLQPQVQPQVASLQRYVAVAGPAGTQYLVVSREEGSEENVTTPKPEEGGGFWQIIGQYFPSIPGISEEKPEVEKPDKEPAVAPAKLEELDEGSMPAAVLPSVNQDQKYILGQPQYFGTYEGLKRLGVQNLNNKGAIPNFLLVRGGNGVHHLGGKPEPEKLQVVPGQAALAFQQSLRERDQAVVVTALKSKSEEGENEDGENVEANGPPGPSVAQVRPQAIALAGPGGVAAAAPMGTALVGPGGLAVAAPAATAVAGPSGGAPPVVAPAHKLTSLYLQAQALGRPGLLAFSP